MPIGDDGRVIQSRATGGRVIQMLAGVGRILHTIANLPIVTIQSVTVFSSTQLNILYRTTTNGLEGTLTFQGTTVEADLDDATMFNVAVQNGMFQSTINYINRLPNTTYFFRFILTTSAGTSTADGMGTTAATGLITWNEAAWTGTRYTGLNTAGNTLTGGSAGNASSRTLTSTEAANTGNARAESVSYSVGRPDATYTPASFTLTHSVTQAAFNAPTPTYTTAQAEANISFSVAQSGLVSLTVTGTLNSANFTNNQNLGVVNSITTRTLTGNYVVPSGFTNTGSTVAISISVDQALTQVVPPSARIENADGTTTDATAVRPATIQLVDASTAGTNPITSAVWSSSIGTMIAVNQSGLVTPFGALPATITLTVSDAFGNSDSDTHEVAFTNPVAPTIDVTPEARSIVEGGGTGLAFTVFATGTNVTVTVAGENAGTLAEWLTVGIDGSWSADENPGALRTATIRFTVRDALSQTTFDEVTVTQAAAAVTVNCFTYTFIPGAEGTDGANIASYTLCDGTVFANTQIPDGSVFSACIREGTALAPGSGSWSQGTGCS